MLQKRLGEEVRALIAGKNRQNKEVAISFAQRTKAKESTIESDLSMLLTGKPGSERQFFETADKIAAFAKALNEKVASLREIFERCARGRYLVLDPALDPSAKAFLLQRQAVADAAFECVETTPEASLREVAAAHPGCLVVLRDLKDAAYYEGARIDTTEVRKVPRGYQLASAPALVTPLPPSPPQTWSSGQPLFTHPELVAAVRAEAEARGLRNDNVGDAGKQHYRHERNRAAPQTAGLSELEFSKLVELAQLVFAADESVEEPAFPLLSILPWLVARSGGALALDGPQFTRDRDRYWSEEPSVKMTLAETKNGPASTLVWWRNERLFSLGPSAAAFAEAMEPLHTVVIVPPELDAWKRALDVRNPFDPIAFSELLEAAKRDAGIDLAGAMEEWKRQVAADDADPSRRRHDETRAKTIDVPSWSATAEHEARAALAGLAARSMSLPHAEITLPLRLRAASRAPLALLARNPFDVVHAVASLGAGRVLRVRIAQFEGKAEAMLKLLVSSSRDPKLIELDGDGTHVWIESLYDNELEGMYVRARARRAEDARRTDD